MQKADSLMNFRLTEHTDILELKRTLLSLISDTHLLHNTLLTRCNQLRDMLTLYESRIQFDELLFLKDKDISRMNEYMC